jgi:hypothetical protein
MRENIQRENPEESWEACTPPLRGQRGSLGRQPLLAPPTRHMRAAGGEVISLATPAPHTTMKELTLCHSAEAGRDARATEATLASHRLGLDYKWGKICPAGGVWP